MKNKALFIILLFVVISCSFAEDHVIGTIDVSGNATDTLQFIYNDSKNEFYLKYDSCVYDIFNVSFYLILTKEQLKKFRDALNWNIDNFTWEIDKYSYLDIMTLSVYIDAKAKGENDRDWYYQNKVMLIFTKTNNVIEISGDGSSLGNYPLLLDKKLHIQQSQITDFTTMIDDCIKKYRD